MIERIIDGYLECAAWADSPEDSRARFPHKARDTARVIVGAFLTIAGPLVSQAIGRPGYSPERFGHDLWLTRTGSGTGFWDRAELECPPVSRVPFVDRDGKPRKWGADATLGEALSAIAYGDEWISPFAYPGLTAYRGWLYFDDDVSITLAREGREPWARQWGPYLQGAAA